MNYSINISDFGSAIQENFPEIPFAHIFGSSANGVVKVGSDIDIAIWYDGSDPFIKLKVLEVLEPVSNNIPVDIVNVYHADPLLAHEALTGNILFVREGQKFNYASFYSKVAAEYEDKIYWIQKQLQYRGYEVQWNH
ncbi:MAG: nucleotidyltransferase domain-containing protein [Bacteroidales bacterium]